LSSGCINDAIGFHNKSLQSYYKDKTGGQV
jgi:hypothetical protein